MTVPATADPSIPAVVDGNDTIGSLESNDKKEEESSSLLPPITATLVDDNIEASMDIAFLSMQELFATAHSTDGAENITTVPSAHNTTTALEPSIVSESVSTDLFEGDLCDDELPSIMNHNGSHTTYENLQLNPVELVEEVQEEVQQEAAKAQASGAPPPAENNKRRAPVVPFAVVRKLSISEIVGEKCSAPAEGKRTADMNATPTTKKAKTDAGSSPPSTGRMTRSRAKREGGPISIAEECLSPSKKAKKAKASPVKAILQKITAAPAPPPKAPTPASAEAAQVPPPAPVVVAPKKPAGAPPATSTIQQQEPNTSKPLAPTPPPTTEEPVITDAASTTSVTETEKPASVPVVTPVGSDEAVAAKQLDLTTKLQSATSLNLPSLSKTTTSNKETKEQVIAKPTTATTKEAAKKPSSSSKRSTKTKAATAKSSVTLAQPEVTIDTSTAHIQALTGENGASVCLSVKNCTFVQATTPTTSTTPAPSSSSKPATVTSSPSTSTNLTEEERAQQSRDRNRKHARNTRLRKKAYVEELKQTLNELVAQRDKTLAEQRQNAQRELEQREVRFRVVEEFLKLRGRNERDADRWSAILAPQFVLTLPLTSSFQTTLATTTTTTTSRGQTLKGVEQVMADSTHFAAFLQSLGKIENAVTISIVHQCDRKDFMMDGCNAVLGFNAQSVGAVEKGASSELSFGGTVRAHFCPDSNRLRTTDIMFDTGTIVDQRDAMLA